VSLNRGGAVGLGSSGRRSCRGPGRSSSTPGTPFGDQEARRMATRETSAWGGKLRGAEQLRPCAPPPAPGRAARA
jgi:hypothetical protein